MSKDEKLRLVEKPRLNQSETPVPHYYMRLENGQIET